MFLDYMAFRRSYKPGALVAPLVKRLTLDFGLGHYLQVMRLSPELDSVLSMEST